MIFYGRITILITTMILLSCEKSATISTKTSSYSPKIHLKTLTSSDPLPKDVKNLLLQEKILDNQSVKFPLAYYLIQEDDAKVFYTSGFDDKVNAQLSMLISGTKYYKLFVHPDLDANYSSLKHAYRYIGFDETEFLASPIFGGKTVVVWTKDNLEKTPFIVKAEIDDKFFPAVGSRIPANTQSGVAPKSVKMIFDRGIRGTKERIEGQQITKIPIYHH